MLKVRFFLNEPCGKPWQRLQEMLPRLGDKYEIEVDTVTKPRAEYQTAEYLKLGLPPAPAVMVADEVVIQGPNLSEDQVEAAIRRHLGLPELPPEAKKGFLDRLFKK